MSLAGRGMASRGPAAANHRPGRGAQAGFSLLEAMVALVLVAIFAGALLSWLNQSVEGQRRLQAAEARLRALDAAADAMASVNPMLNPSGRLDLAPWVVTWQATPLEAVRSAASLPNGSHYDIGLYRTQVRVLAGQRDLGSFALTQVGYQQTIFPSY